jgi:hypothetical protein
MARTAQRPFATIGQLLSKRWQVCYTAPVGIRGTLSHSSWDLR